MSSPKPILALVPGSFNPSSVYAPLLVTFTSHGYAAHPIDLRTVGKKPGSPPSMYDDAAHINSELAKLADEGEEIVLVGHSYGGIPVSESIKGVSKAEREKMGKKGGVVRVAYMTALVPEVGGNAASALEGGPSGYTDVGEDGWMTHPDPALTAKYAFSDLPLSEGTKWVKTFSEHSAISFANELTYAGYKDVPVSYLFCEADECVIPAAQQRAIDVIEKANGGKVDVTRIKSDHCPNVSHPEMVVDWFVGLVEKGGKE
ncbi:alpha/beta-hydrolase [Lentithecium fluviatile CBS 122367]|uniref:Alpha/beta-hydrolase n=1 Tax=Lentithecium fluviatile CBS 122367 TaxID=1168545 RepID=A0A6G1J273_9PLEO|nr:alpha/beta-hydrolase [Lentithecium fluviatile CBS 122367]